MDASGLQYPPSGIGTELDVPKGVGQLGRARNLNNNAVGGLTLDAHRGAAGVVSGGEGNR